MRRTRRLGAVVAAAGLLMASSVTVAPQASGTDRANDWVEVWCDSNTANADGNAITLSVDASGTTQGGADDVRAKVVDASAFDPGMKDSNHYNRVAGVVQGWFCGVLRYADGTIVNET
jgi:hypothetical protein